MTQRKVTNMPTMTPCRQPQVCGSKQHIQGSAKEKECIASAKASAKRGKQHDQFSDSWKSLPKSTKKSDGPQTHFKMDSVAGPVQFLGSSSNSYMLRSTRGTPINVNGIDTNVEVALKRNPRTGEITIAHFDAVRDGVPGRVQIPEASQEKLKAMLLDEAQAVFDDPEWKESLRHAGKLKRAANLEKEKGKRDEVKAELAKVEKTIKKIDPEGKHDPSKKSEADLAKAVEKEKKRKSDLAKAQAAGKTKKAAPEYSYDESRIAVHLADSSHIDREMDNKYSWITRNKLDEDQLKSATKNNLTSEEVIYDDEVKHKITGDFADVMSAADNANEENHDSALGRDVDSANATFTEERKRASIERERIDAQAQSESYSPPEVLEESLFDSADDDELFGETYVPEETYKAPRTSMPSIGGLPESAVDSYSQEGSEVLSRHLDNLGYDRVVVVDAEDESNWLYALNKTKDGHLFDASGFRDSDDLRSSFDGLSSSGSTRIVDDIYDVDDILQGSEGNFELNNFSMDPELDALKLDTQIKIALAEREAVAQAA